MSKAEIRGSWGRMYKQQCSVVHSLFHLPPLLPSSLTQTLHYKLLLPLALCTIACTTSPHNLLAQRLKADFRSPDRPSRSEPLYRMSYPDPPAVASIVRKCREITDILTPLFDVVVSGNKTVTQQRAGKQQVLSHVTVAATQEPALERPLIVRAAD
jgi:hypothetical protein